MKIVKVILIITTLLILSGCEVKNSDLATIEHFEYSKIRGADTDSIQYDEVDKEEVQSILELINVSVQENDFDAISKIDSAKTIFELHLRRDDNLIIVSLYVNDDTYTLGYGDESGNLLKEEIYQLSEDDDIIKEYKRILDNLD